MTFCFKLIFYTSAAALCLGVLNLQAAEPAEVQRVKTVVRVDARTGKLIRAVVSSVHPVAGQAATPALDAAVRQIAAEQSLPPELLHSVIQVESNYNTGAVSPKGAQGLMQLIPETARRFGVSDSFDPVENIQGGAKYLKYLLDLYKGDYPRALAAYNAGEKAVAKYGGVPPYAETQNYVTRVQKRMGEKPPAQANIGTKLGLEVKAVETPADGPRHIVEVRDADGAVRYVTR
jgi:soluble lytic murein transglycosylase-like protein